MVQATENGLGVDVAQLGRFDGPRLRAVLLQPQMSPASVVVVQVVSKH